MWIRSEFCFLYTLNVSYIDVLLCIRLIHIQSTILKVYVYYIVRVLKAIIKLIWKKTSNALWMIDCCLNSVFQLFSWQKQIYKQVIMDKKCGSMMGISEEVYITTGKRGYDWYDREILLSNGTSMNRNEPPMDRKSILLSNLK